MLPHLNTNIDREPKSLHEHESAVIAHSNSSTPPPSAYGTSWSPMSKTSTGQTSLSNSLRSQTSVERRTIHDQYASQNRSVLPCTEELACIEESGVHLLSIPCEESPYEFARPSVTTVESVAAAKIFFETHFDSLLSDLVSPRSMRRRKMEQRLWAVSCTSTEREQAYETWIQAESDHLRQVRVLKSSSLARHESKGISIAGYETVRVLGKGSFGIVRLVREKAVGFAPGPFGSSSDDTLTDNGDHYGNAEGPMLGHNNKAKEVYAMKVIRKSEMLRNCQEGHLRAERDILVASEGSRWIVPLIASFQDNTNLYLVMEYMIGGDFLGMLLREDMLDEWVARWYMAEMILGIEEAHKMNWIHRDIKPDNFLISSSGHLKISDFGLAFDGHWSHSQSYYSGIRYSVLDKLGISIRGDDVDVQDEDKNCHVGPKMNGSGKTGKRKPDADDGARREGLLNWRDRTERKRLARSIVGTSQYMAPEVILGQQYDGRCDWWSIGIILYEVLSK